MKSILKNFVLLLCTLSLLYAVAHFFHADSISCSSYADPVIYTNGGTLPPTNDGENYSSLEQIVFTTPTKEGMEFAGWYSNPDFTGYINPSNISVDQLKKGTAYAKWIVPPTEKGYAVREDEMTITDSGRANQACDCIPITDDFNVIDLTHAGYRSLRFKVALDIKEVNDGFQYAFLYANTSCASGGESWMEKFSDAVFGDDSDPSLLYLKKWDTKADGVQKTYVTSSFTVTIPLADIRENVYIRYGASGKYDDDWINKNVNVVVTPIK